MRKNLNFKNDFLLFATGDAFEDEKCNKYS